MAQISQTAVRDLPVAIGHERCTDNMKHVVRRLVPQMVLKSNDAKGFTAALNNFMEVLRAIGNGEKVEVVDDAGKTLRALTPSDELPAKAPVITDGKAKTKVDGKDVTVDIKVASHGGNMAKSYPTDFAGIANAINDAIVTATRTATNSKLVSAFVSGGEGAAESISEDTLKQYE